jgi:preprotein translocase subunit SecY
VARQQITERGIGNGISMIILSSILSGLPAAIGGTLELVNNGGMNQAMPFLLACSCSVSRPRSCSWSARGASP